MGHRVRTSQTRYMKKQLNLYQKTPKEMTRVIVKQCLLLVFLQAEILLAYIHTLMLEPSTHK